MGKPKQNIKQNRNNEKPKNKKRFVEKGVKNNPNFKSKKPQTQMNKPKPSKPNKQEEQKRIYLEQKNQAKIQKEAKIAEYKKKRLEKTKVISKKTSRGQPLMKNRIEYLLKQIQESKRN